MPTPYRHRAESPWFSLTFSALNVNTSCVFLAYSFSYIRCAWPLNSYRNTCGCCSSVWNIFRTPRTALRSPRVIPQRDFCQAEAPRGENNCSRCDADLWVVRTRHPWEHNYFPRNYNTLFVWACEPYEPDYNLILSYSSPRKFIVSRLIIEPFKESISRYNGSPLNDL